MSGLSLATFTGLAGASIDFEPFVAYDIGLDSGSGPGMVTIGDVNADGHLDIVSANYKGNEFPDFIGVNWVTIRLNQGDGTFSSPELIKASTNQEPQQVAIADLDQSGMNDIIIANGGAAQFDNVNVYLNRGKNANNEWLGYPAREQYTVGQSPYSITAGDFDGDGDIDCITSNRFDRNASYLENRGTYHGNWGGFNVYDLLPVNTTEGEAKAVHSGDLNGDGLLDIAIADQHNLPGGPDGGQIIILFNTGSGNVPFPNSLSDVDYVVLDETDGVPFNPQDVHMDDINVDGHLDLLVTGPSGAADTDVVVFFNDGTGDFSSSSLNTTDFPNFGALSTESTDFDADGDVDVIVCGQAFACDGGVRLLENKGLDGSGNWLGFEDDISIPINASNCSLSCGGDTGDLDGDGNPDFIAGDRTSVNHVAVLIQE